MDEFLNRITAQRRVINMINKEQKFSSPLVGLSVKSLQRWKQENSVSDNSEILKSLMMISSKLFFLANKSQEQITDEYKLLSKYVNELIDQLRDKIQKFDSTI